MEPPRDEKLIADLRALRPTPRPQFATELDERAAAGFRRRSRLPRLSFDWLHGIPPRRLLVPAGAAALLAVAVATALVMTSESKRGSSAEVAVLRPEERHRSVVPSATGGGPTPPAHTSEEASETMYESVVPTIASKAAGSEGAAGAAAHGAAGASYNSTFSPRHRDIERSAEVTLAAEPEDVADDAAKVFEAVHAHDGIVIRSSTRQGAAGEAGATFELLIPSARLGDAMAAFSEIDAVRSRHEATADITAPTVTAAELLKQSRAGVDSLLAQLGEAESEEQRQAVETELRRERRHAGRLGAKLTHLHRRADLSRVSLRIETGEAKESSGTGTWGIDDALHDAGHVLTVAAGIALIALAILAPIALIALLAWLTHRTWVQRERRRALG